MTTSPAGSRTCGTIATTDTNTLSGLLDEVADQLPLADVDPAGLDLNPVLDKVVAFGAELRARARALAAELDRPADRVGRRARGRGGGTSPIRTEARATIDALKALLGEDVLVVPEYTLPATRSATTCATRSDRRDDLVAAPDPGAGVPGLPGGRLAARHRPGAGDAAAVGAGRAAERRVARSRAACSSDDSDTDEPLLHPVQLPFRMNDHWLGMELATGATIDEDRLLFTAHYAEEPERGDGPSCGLLFDEWTEVLPAERETTGIAVHARQPGLRAAAGMLLVVPPVPAPGRWQLTDLVDAITETFDLAKHPAGRAGPAGRHRRTRSCCRRPCCPRPGGQSRSAPTWRLANLRWKADHD